MNKIFLPIILFAVAFMVAACSSETPELKSPCVGAENSPCERRAPINNFV